MRLVLHQLYQFIDDGMIENTYLLKVSNKTPALDNYSISIQGLKEFQYLGKQQIAVNAGGALNAPLSVVIAPYELEKSTKGFEFNIALNLESGNKGFKKTNFFKGR